MHSVTRRLRDHYAARFAEFGPTPRGVDWRREEDVELRYRQMLALIENEKVASMDTFTLLDVGCGYGGLYTYAKRRWPKMRYVGVEVAEEMINHAARHIPEARFYCEDVLSWQVDERFDYVVCNGILTQKLDISIAEMDQFAHALIKKMFSLCNQGIAFNVMTTKVNYMMENLYYRNPVELFAYCLTEITKKVRIDHAYPLYEYTVYLYR
jgi:SAM-dependent methyltransferase